MRRIVVDASIAVPWFVPEIHSDAAERLLDTGISLCAPDLILTELANTLWKKARRREITPQQASEIMIAFGKMGVEIVPSSDLVPVALMLASSLDQTVYDTLYLTLAIARGCVLVTADRKFHSAVTSSGIAQYIRWIDDETEHAAN